MSKKSSTQNNNLAMFTVAIFVIAVVIIAIEVISINYNNNKTEKKLAKNKITRTQQTIQEKEGIYDTSNITFTGINLTNSDTPIQTACIDGCNLSIIGNDYKFIIKKNAETSEYKLDIVNNNKPVIENKSLGTSLEGASLVNYLDYITLKVRIKQNDFYYDYALFIDKSGDLDEISSLNANEMGFLENGIIYYYDVCEKTYSANGKKVKAVRVPFSEQPAILSSELANFSWCN